MTKNEQRAEELIKRLGFEFDSISKDEIRELLEQEIANKLSEHKIVDYEEDQSSEYIRLLCGYLYCLGDITDIPLLEKAKYGINFDVECMIDGEWIDSLKNGGVEAEYVPSRDDIIKNFISYYKHYFGLSKSDNE